MNDKALDKAIEESMRDKSSKNPWYAFVFLAPLSQPDLLHTSILYYYLLLRH
jgi:hypothetical protein